MRVAILGPLEVSVGDRPVQLAGGRLRSTLSRLAVAAPQPVGTAELIETIWGEDPPADATNALQALVSRLRRAIGDPAVVIAEPRGYRLAAARSDVDASEFRDLVDRAGQLSRSGQVSDAMETYDRALALWRGPALGDLADSVFSQGFAADLDHIRLQAFAGRFEAALALDRAEEVLTDLQRLVDDHPLREDFARQLIMALARSGRGAEAAEAYARIRSAMADQLGTDPGADLQELHLQLLRGELEPRRPDASPPGLPAPTKRPRAAGLGAPLTSFVGRETEVRRLRSLLDGSRLTTVVGPGGAGKTRLATETARSWTAQTGRPAWLVELAPVTSENGLVGAVLDALGLQHTRILDRPERVGRDDHDRLIDALGASDGLLVIDNCEHLITAVAELIDEIVAVSPDLRVLATSREPLGLTGEALTVVPPLGLPPPDATAAQAVAYPAVQLFCDRAAAVRPDFALDDASIPDVIMIVRRLDGLPLAIELAVARMRVFTLADIAHRLSDRFRLLTGGNRTSLPRHRTLRAVVDWSWELLSEPERLLAERLAVFPAGAGEETATAICADDELPVVEIGELLITLAEKSLLVPQATTPVRYRMLETIREYGIERLAERGQLDEARVRHAEYFASLIESLEPVLRTDRQLDALALVRAEEGNVLSARRFLLDSGRLHAALTMTLAMSWLTMITGNTREVSWLAQVIEAHRGLDDPYLVYAEALHLMASLGESTEAFSWESIRPQMSEMYRRVEAASAAPPYGSLQAMTAMLPVYAGLDLEAEQAMLLGFDSPDPWVRAVVHASAAAWAENRGDTDRMRSEVKLAEEGFRQTGDRWGIATVAGTRAQLRQLDGDAQGALVDLQAALMAADQLGASDDTRYLRMRMAGVMIQLGRGAEAREELGRLREDDTATRRGLDEDLMIDAMFAMASWFEGDQEAAVDQALAIRHRIEDRRADSLMAGHAHSIGLSSTAVILADAADDHPGRLQMAMDDLASAYPAAVRTEDMPIVSQLGFGLALCAWRLGRSADAAEILGAAARLRGGDSHDPKAAALVGALRAELGSGYDERYVAGRSLDRLDAVARMDPARLTNPDAP